MKTYWSETASWTSAIELLPRLPLRIATLFDNFGRDKPAFPNSTGLMQSGIKCILTLLQRHVHRFRLRLIWSSAA